MLKHGEKRGSLALSTLPSSLDFLRDHQGWLSLDMVAYNGNDLLAGGTGLLSCYVVCADIESIPLDQEGLALGTVSILIGVSRQITHIDIS